jgi:hypothetical protein
MLEVDAEIRQGTKQLSQALTVTGTPLTDAYGSARLSPAL